MKKSVIAIGLDAADPSLIETWISQGKLKNLCRLREQGMYQRLKTFEYYRAETPWTTFLTGCSPQKTGYWSPVKFCEDTYGTQQIQAYDFREYKPFYALGDRYRVAVVDMPQAPLSDDVNGIQLLAWGAHSPQTPSHSNPSSLFQEMLEKHGEHPVLRKDHASIMDVDALRHLQQALKTGIARRSAICQDLIQRDRWDLFLTIFGETHGGGHYLWHLSQPDHPLYDAIGSQYAADALLEIFEEIDQAIGEILDKAPEDSQVIVFAAHGMGGNVMDLPSMVFLPEFLYRFNFPGKFGIARGRPGQPLGAPITGRRAKRGWLGSIWSLKHESNPIKGFLRRTLPTKVFNRIAPIFGTPQHPDLMSPFELRTQAEPFYYQPAVWYKAFWSQMKAFALPSFSEGYIRINLQGREPQGVVLPSEYEALCDELSQALYQLKDARTGTPMVKNIIRTRQALDTCSPDKLPDADLVIIWQDEHITDTVESPDVGRIGPVPYHRTGSHRSDGFVVVQGSTISHESIQSEGHALDLAPTILEMMGALIPKHMEGSPLVKKAALIP